MSILYSLNSRLKQLLPKSFYQKVRGYYFSFLKKRQKKFSREEFKALLQERLGVKEGVDVFIHSSINQINLDFPYYEIVAIIQEVVGEKGTLLFPVWKNIKNFEEYAKNQVFDVKRTTGDMGILPELVRRRKDAHRSLHPVNSIVAIGYNAEWYINTHHQDIYPAGYKSPFYKLIEKKGMIIGLGVSSRYLSFSHCIEDIMGTEFPLQTRSSEALTFKVKKTDGELIEVKSLVPHKNIVDRDVPKFLKKHIPKEIAEDLKIGGTAFFTVQAKELAERMIELGKKGITIYNF